METENFPFDETLFFEGNEHFEHPASLAHCRQIFQKQVYSERLNKQLLQLKSEQHSLSTGEQKTELNCSFVQLQLQKNVFQVAHQLEPYNDGKVMSSHDDDVMSTNNVKMMSNCQEQQTHYSFGPFQDVKISCKVEVPVEEEFVFRLIEAEKEENDVSDDSDYGSPSKKLKKDSHSMPKLSSILPRISVESAGKDADFSESDDEADSDSDATCYAKDSDYSNTDSDGTDDNDDSDVPPVLEPSVLAIATDTEKLSNLEETFKKVEILENAEILEKDKILEIPSKAPVETSPPPKIESNSKIETPKKFVPKKRITKKELNDSENSTVPLMQEKAAYKAKDGSGWSTEPFISTCTQLRARPAEAALVGPAKDPKLTEIQLFKMMFTPSMVDTILKYTNKFGESDFPNLQASKRSPWKPITKDEIYAYIGILLYLGAEKKRHVQIQDAWTLDPRYIIPSIVATMSRERYGIITRYLRFDDRESRKNAPNDDPLQSKLGYISEIFDPFVRNIESHVAPQSNLVVDEMLVKYTGKVRFRVYMKSKPGKYGMKIWCVCDATTGYVLRLCIYEGKIGNRIETELGKKAVLGLVEKYFGSGLTVTTDNFFTSKSLGHELLKRNMKLLGTLNKSRMDVIPEFVEGKGREVQSSMFAFQKPFTMVSYVQRKNKPVLLLSTAHNSPEINMEIKQKPQMILDYNATKSGVDTADAMIANYSCQRATKRWPMKLFNAMCDIVALDAFIIWKIHRKAEQKTDKTTERRDFLLRLSQNLMEPVIMARNINGRVVGFVPAIDGAIKLMLKSFGSADTDEPVGSGVKSKGGKVTWPFANHQKMGACRVCPGKPAKKKNTRSRCASCGNWICADHMTIIRHCPKCPYLPPTDPEQPKPKVKPTPKPRPQPPPTILFGIQNIPDMD